MWRQAMLALAPLALATCSVDGEVRVASTVSTPSSSTTASGPARIVAAGDIALCGSPAAATALLLGGLPGTLAVLGDGAGPAGKLEKNYLRCYEPTWGRHRGRTRPVPGDNDYDGGETADGYFTYFGEPAGERGKGYSRSAPTRTPSKCKVTVALAFTASSRSGRARMPGDGVSIRSQTTSSSGVRAAT